MRPLALLAVLLTTLAPISHAATIEQEITEAERLNELCRGGSGDNPATARYCEKRDAAYSALQKRGWCWGHSGQAMYQMAWEPCPKLPASRQQPDQGGNLPNGYGVAIVGLGAINDGTVHMLVLSTSSVGTPPVPTYCGDGWSVGFIKSAHKSKIHNNAMIDMPGCWASSGENPENAQIKFRYYSLDPATSGVKEFSVKAKRFERMMLNNNTGDVFFQAEARH